jgi:large subunit ribosomal protein L35
MPKMKTQKSAAKRFRVSSNGKVKYKKQGLRHILTKKTAKRKRNLRHAGILDKTETKKVRRLLPHQF